MQSVITGLPVERWQCAWRSARWIKGLLGRTSPAVPLQPTGPWETGVWWGLCGTNNSLRGSAETKKNPKNALPSYSPLSFCVGAVAGCFQFWSWALGSMKELERSIMWLSKHRSPVLLELFHCLPSMVHQQPSAVAPLLWSSGCMFSLWDLGSGGTLEEHSRPGRMWF